MGWKGIVILAAIGILFIPASATAGDYGAEWISMSRKEKILYVMGYYDHVERSCNWSSRKNFLEVDRLLYAECIEKNSVEDLEYVVKIVTDIYKSKKYKNIPFSNVLELTTSKIKGKKIDGALDALSEVATPQ